MVPQSGTESPFHHTGPWPDLTVVDCRGAQRHNLAAAVQRVLIDGRGGGSNDLRGHEGVRDWWETVRGTLRNVQWESADVRGSGDRGVAKSRLTATLGGLRVEQTMWQAAKLRDGTLEWWAFFRTEREAVEAVGLPE